MNATSHDVAVIGAGPNGLTAAAVLANAGLSVLVLERNANIGGSCRTESLTLPGFAHDTCAAIHPVGAASPIFRKLRLHQYGLHWMTAPTPLAHPFDDGRAAVLSGALSDTAARLGRDGERWRRLLEPFVARHEAFFSDILRPVRLPPHPWLMAQFARLGLRSCAHLVQRFETADARALFAGNAAHAFLPLDAIGSASFGLVLTIAAHTVDWPFAKGGAQQIVEALAACAVAAGCEIRTDAEVDALGDVSSARAVLLDLTPRQVDAVAGAELSASYRRQLGRFRYGPGAFKVDYALSEPIPWTSPQCAAAATVHVGGTYEEIAQAEQAVSVGRVPHKPFVLVAQPSRFDTSRAPEGRHTGWAYCHVPHGATVDMTERIEQQIERFAPGFRDTILARHVRPPRALEAYNPNLVGGDISGGANTFGQVMLRPAPRWNPYATSNPRVFVCSSSTPPGGGVHGMCGYWAARTVLRRVFRQSIPAPLDI